MKFILFLLHLAFCFLLSVLLFIPILIFFKPIFLASHLRIPYAIYPFDICLKAPIAWKYMKIIYCLCCYYVCFLFSNSIYSIIFKNKINLQIKEKNIKTNSRISLYLGNNFSTNTPIYLTEKGLYQNLLVTGTIGTGKTSSSMYPFAKQLIEYKADNDFEKLGMLILDVKGNFYKQIKITYKNIIRYTVFCRRENFCFIGIFKRF